MRRALPILLLGAALPGAALAGARAEAEAAPRLRSGSLQAVCARLSGRLAVEVVPEPSQADLRVLWPEPDATSLPAALARLAELTDSEVVQGERQAGRDRYTLERRAGTLRREQGWESAALSSAVSRLRLAYLQAARGDRRAAAASSSAHYLALEHADLAARFLQTLTLDRLRALVAGEEVRCPPELLTEPEGKRLVRSIARGGRPAEQEETDEDDDNRTLQNLELLRRYGVGLRLDPDHGTSGGGDGAFLLLTFSKPGEARIFTAFPLGELPDTDLGLPLTRSNPYRVLEGKGARPVPLTQLPARLREPLRSDLSLPARTPWREALDAFTRASGLPVVSDDYLFRRSSGSVAPAVEAPAGSSTAEALDRLCAAYRYLWWEKDGCLYFRSRCWPRDVQTEVPPRVVEQFARSLSRRGQLGAAEVAALSTLTRRQLQSLSRSPHRAFPGFSRYYAGLPPEQQAVMLSEGAVVRGEGEFLAGLAGRARSGELLRLYLEQKSTPLPEKSPRAWDLQLILHLGSVASGSPLSSHFFALHVPRPDPEAPAETQQ